MTWNEPDIADIARDVQSGDLNAAALIARASDCHAKHADFLSAYRHWDGDNARQTADEMDKEPLSTRRGQPLWGIPVSVKDLFGQSGARTYAGTPNPLPKKWEQDGPFVSAFRRSGAVFVGRTNMVEFAFGALGTNSHWPEPRNPWDMNVHRVAGGSSSGAGVSLIEGSALVALGTDTAGSVRIPASVTGTVGFKPSKDRWSTEGIVPLSQSFDVPGFLTRTVKDAAYVFGAVDHQLTRDRGMRELVVADLSKIKIGRMDSHFWDTFSPGIAEKLETAIQKVVRAGATLSALNINEVEEAYSLFINGGLAASEFREFLVAELPAWKKTLDPRIAARLDVGPKYGGPAYIERKARFGALATAANRTLSEVDVIITPTVTLTAPLMKDVEDVVAYGQANMSILRNTCIANLLNFCALTIPVGYDAAGVPVGMQLMSTAGNDQRLVEIGLAVEEAIRNDLK